MGRKSKYTDPVREKILQLLKEGKTEKQVAQVLGVSLKTIANWKGKHVELLHAVNESKLVADELVEMSLFRRATGYTHPEQKVFCTKDGMIVTHNMRKHYPPETQAAMFWLRNRQPERWREKNEGDVNVNNSLSVDNLTDEQLEARIAAMLAKSKPNAEKEDK